MVLFKTSSWTPPKWVILLNSRWKMGSVKEVVLARRFVGLNFCSALFKWSQKAPVAAYTNGDDSRSSFPKRRNLNNWQEHRLCYDDFEAEEDKKVTHLMLNKSTTQTGRLMLVKICCLWPMVLPPCWNDGCWEHIKVYHVRLNTVDALRYD